jgi:predicted alpha/beta-hydrolase family hydrolase
MDRFRIEVDAQRSVSALLLEPSEPTACFVFAHGAGAGMTHPFMEAVAQRLYERGIVTLRYQFPYMEARAKKPDPPTIAHATVCAAVNAARERLPNVRIIAGGKSFGARMTSQAQAASPLPDVTGLAFLGFPLHPAGKPSSERAAHLAQVKTPMLFLQGARDKLAELSLIRSVTRKLGAAATLYEIEGADHSFHVSAKSGRKDDEVIREAVDVFSQWVERLCHTSPKALR